MKFNKVKINFGFAYQVALNKKVEFGYGKEYYIPVRLMNKFNPFRVNKLITVDEKVYSENELDSKLKVFTGMSNVDVKDFLKGKVINIENKTGNSTENKPKDQTEMTKKEMISMIMDLDENNSFSESKLNKMNKTELTSILTGLSEKI